MNITIWLGILFCVTQSAMFSGLNLAFFSIPRLRLEIEAEHSKAAKKILKMRQDSNFLLATILWGNVGINVLLTLLSNSIMFGLVAFSFSTFVITFAGEILPQAYFSRHALKMASLLSPVLRMYQFILFPVAKPSAILLDMWLGEETLHYFKERSLHQLIKKHVESASEIEDVEGLGAMNFLTLDDIPIGKEGERVDPDSIIMLPFDNDKPLFPEIDKTPLDKFLQKVHKSQKKWVILVDEDEEPKVVLNADGFIRSALLDEGHLNPMKFIDYPIIIKDWTTPLGDVLGKFEVKKLHGEDDVIDLDIILLWGHKKRIITGADILGRLLRGISKTSD